MPIKIQDGLPAAKVLESENIFVMGEGRAETQDIRPLRILLVNLMPTKVETETQLLRLLSNTPLQVEVELLQMASHVSKNTPQEHLLKFYKTFPDIQQQRFDGMIITGAPVETMQFEDVDYWSELCSIMEWSTHNVFSTFHICWGAQAGLYYHYGIPKYPLGEKRFGIFLHNNLRPDHPLLRGFDEQFWAPHSRHTEVRAKDIKKVPELVLLSESDEAGVYLIASQDSRRFFAMGHSEYDRMTLAGEYFRDLNRGLTISMPAHYFPQNDPNQTPLHIWRSHANLLFSNWLNYFVYQRTPYDLTELQPG